MLPGRRRRNRAHRAVGQGLEPAKLPAPRLSCRHCCCPGSCAGELLQPVRVGWGQTGCGCRRLGLTAHAPLLRRFLPPPARSRVPAPGCMTCSQRRLHRGRQLFRGGHSSKSELLPAAPRVAKSAASTTHAWTSNTSRSSNTACGCGAYAKSWTRVKRTSQAVTLPPAASRPGKSATASVVLSPAAPPPPPRLGAFCCGPQTRVGREETRGLKEDWKKPCSGAHALVHPRACARSCCCNVPRPHCFRAAWRRRGTAVLSE